MGLLAAAVAVHFKAIAPLSVGWPGLICMGDRGQRGNGHRLYFRGHHDTLSRVAPYTSFSPSGSTTCTWSLADSAVLLVLI